MAPTGRHHGRHTAYRAFRWATAGATALSVLAVGGTAMARWSTSGSGSGTGATSSGAPALTTTAVVASGGVLVPGGAPVALSVQVDNAGTAPVTVTGISLDTSRAVAVSGAAGTCADPALSVTAPGWSGLTVPAGGSTGATTIAGAVSMGAGADSGCQGATFTIPVTLTGHN